MRVFICLDDENGMMFNNRRQSRDRYVLEDMLRISRGTGLYMSAYSQPIFDGLPGAENITVQASGLVLNDAYVFVEGESLAGYQEHISEIIVYRWNTIYPSDMSIDIDLCKWNLTETVDFEGYSHDYITRETYMR